MRTVIAIALAAAAVAAALCAFVWFGGFNISAVDPHWEVTRKLIEIARDRSIEVRSGDVSLPPLSLDDPALLKSGAAEYHRMCKACHAAPGYREEIFSQGLYPAPADLMSGQVQAQWNDGALFWIVCNGLKMTGMPSFCVTHDKEELYGVVVLLRRLPGMKAEEYRSLVEDPGTGE